MDEDSPHYDPKNNVNSLGLEGYSKWYPDIDNCMFMEATPDYITQRTALRVLGEMEPKPAVLIVLRKPSERAMSAYRFFSQHIRLPVDADSFYTFVKKLSVGELYGNEAEPHNQVVDVGFYNKHLERWVNALGRDKLGIFLFEEMRDDPRVFMEKVCDFLNISSDFYDDYHFPVKNVSGQVRVKWLHDLLRKWVLIFLPSGRYRHYTSYLYNFFNRSYRRPSLSKDDRLALRFLDELYADDISKLPDRYGIDVSVWRKD